MSNYLGRIPSNDPFAPNTEPAPGPTFNSSTKIPDVGATFRPSESNPGPPPMAGVVSHGPRDRMPRE